MFPYHNVFELTYRCNYRCRFCYCEGRGFPREQGVEEWRRIVRSLREYGGAKNVTLSGGEPFVYDGFEDVLKMLREEGVPIINVFTNASLLDEKRIEFLAENHAGVYASLSGRNQYSDLTSSSCGYDVVLGNLKTCASMKVPVFVSSVLVRDNIEEMESVAEDCFSVGANGIQFGYVMHEGAAARNRRLWLSWKQKIEVLGMFLALKKRFPEKILLFASETKCCCRNRYWRFLSRLCGRKCRTERNCIVIAPDGLVRPCVHRSDRTPVPMFTPEQEVMFTRAAGGENMWVSRERTRCLGH